MYNRVESRSPCNARFPYGARIALTRGMVRLGYYETEEQAAMSYDQCYIYQVGCCIAAKSLKALRMPHGVLIIHKSPPCRASIYTPRGDVVAMCKSGLQFALLDPLHVLPCRDANL